MNRPKGAPRVGHWITYVSRGVFVHARIISYDRFKNDFIVHTNKGGIHLSNENTSWRRGKFSRDSFAGQALLAAIAIMR